MIRLAEPGNRIVTHSARVSNMYRREFCLTLPVKRCPCYPVVNAMQLLPLSSCAWNRYHASADLLVATFVLSKKDFDVNAALSCWKTCPCGAHDHEVRRANLTRTCTKATLHEKAGS